MAGPLPSRRRGDALVPTDAYAIANSVAFVGVQVRRSEPVGVVVKN